MLDLVSAKDLAGQLTDHDWNLFNRIHQVLEVELRRGGGCGPDTRPSLLTWSLPHPGGADPLRPGPPASAGCHYRKPGALHAPLQRAAVLGGH